MRVKSFKEVRDNYLAIKERLDLEDEEVLKILEAFKALPYHDRATIERSKLEDKEHEEAIAWAEKHTKPPIKLAEEPSEPLTREEHLKWAKEKALTKETTALMWTSFMKDINKHEELAKEITTEEAVFKLTQPLKIVKKYIEEKQ